MGALDCEIAMRLRDSKHAELSPDRHWSASRHRRDPSQMPRLFSFARYVSCEMITLNLKPLNISELIETNRTLVLLPK
jgi:hypothetical protein